MKDGINRSADRYRRPFGMARVARRSPAVHSAVRHLGDTAAAGDLGIDAGFGLVDLLEDLFRVVFDLELVLGVCRALRFLFVSYHILNTINGTPNGPR